MDTDWDVIKYYKWVKERDDRLREEENRENSTDDDQTKISGPISDALNDYIKQQKEKVIKKLLGK